MKERDVALNDRRAIDVFVDEFIARISRCYYDELLYFSSKIPHPLLNFNNVLMLKKGQKYIAHTWLDFQKALAHCIVALCEARDLIASSVATNSGKGRGVYIQALKERIHFVGQEMLVGFPRVAWLDNWNEGARDLRDVYLLLVKNDVEGRSVCEEAMELLRERGISSKVFVIFEEYIVDRLGRPVWELFSTAFEKIEMCASSFRRFDLTANFNSLTRPDFEQEVRSVVMGFDYENEIEELDPRFPISDLKKLVETYFSEERYRTLFVCDDVRSSLLASEWLYKNMISNGLEKTFLIAGYLKSVEQLLSFVIRNSNCGEGTRIGIAGRAGYVDVDIQSEEFSRATLGNLAYFMNSVAHREMFLPGLRPRAIHSINCIIQQWINNERNGYFHRHNLDSTERVNSIRRRTYVLYFLILAAIPVHLNATHGSL